MNIELSVVIPTYNRADMLKGTIESLFNQSLNKERFEIIIIDDGSMDETPDILNQVKNQSRHRLRTYRQKNQLSGSARNLGITMADGYIILSMDDDMTAYPELLECHLNLHLKNPEIEYAVLGKVIAGKDGIDLLTPNNRQIICESKTDNGYPLVDVSYFTTQNVSIKKEFVIQAGMFTPGLPRLDDFDLVFRLKERGLKLIYCAEAFAIHNMPYDTIEKIVNSGKLYGRTLGEFYDQIPQFRKEITSLGARFNGGWKSFIHHPYIYFKDAIRRWAVNRYTAGLLLRIASRIPVTNPPKRILVRCCKEIWSYYYRAEFKAQRRQFIMK